MPTPPPFFTVAPFLEVHLPSSSVLHLLTNNPSRTGPHGPPLFCFSPHSFPCSEGFWFTPPHFPLFKGFFLLPMVFLTFIPMSAGLSGPVSSSRYRPGYFVFFPPTPYKQCRFFFSENWSLCFPRRSSLVPSIVFFDFPLFLTPPPLSYTPLFMCACLFFPVDRCPTFGLVLFLVLILFSPFVAHSFRAAISIIAVFYLSGSCLQRPCFP